MTAPASTPRMPFDRPNALDLPPLFDVLRAQGPVSPVITPAGDPAWLVTGYEEARALLGDRRFGRSHPEPEHASRISEAAISAGPTGEFDAEERDHTRMRRVLTPAFSVPRMRRLSARVEQLADECLDDLEAARAASPDAPVDLHENLSFPLPVRVICELLGVPESDRDLFRSWSDRIGILDGAQDARSAMADFQAYMGRLAEHKRTHPGHDVVTDIVAVQAEDPTFTEHDMTQLAAGLLFAGHETTSTRIDFGVLFLLSDPARRDHFAADPAGNAPAVVEEVLRMAAPGGLGLVRYAREDVTLGPVTVRRGDALLISINAANRDGAAFEEPNAFRTDRAPNPHLAFGHGGHYCVGNALARTEMRIALTRLFTRLPGLRLAVDPHSLAEHPRRLTGGLTEVPVLW
ncbi:cytochrome P450 (plasmid) [Streptomyces sp. BI20]|uniref:cytochrome P450 n=1 Tax=Streptomyces sp. BI20 TaxID=3403460 RepID=UPI003C76F774